MKKCTLHWHTHPPTLSDDVHAIECVEACMLNAVERATTRAAAANKNKVRGEKYGIICADDNFVLCNIVLRAILDIDLFPSGTIELRFLPLQAASTPIKCQR